MIMEVVRVRKGLLALMSSCPVGLRGHLVGLRDLLLTVSAVYEELFFQIGDAMQGLVA